MAKNCRLYSNLQHYYINEKTKNGNIIEDTDKGLFNYLHSISERITRTIIIFTAITNKLFILI